MGQYKVEWSYLNSDNKRVHQTDVFTTFSAEDAVKEIREEYQDVTDFRIEDVWKDRNDVWAHIDRNEYEGI